MLSACESLTLPPAFQILYIEGEDEYVTTDCLPERGHDCGPNGHDYMLGGQKFWSLGGSDMHRDKEVCDSIVAPPPMAGSGPFGSGGFGSGPFIRL